MSQERCIFSLHELCCNNHLFVIIISSTEYFFNSQWHTKLLIGLVRKSTQVLSLRDGVSIFFFSYSVWTSLGFRLYPHPGRATWLKHPDDNFLFETFSISFSNYQVVQLEKHKEKQSHKSVQLQTSPPITEWAFCSINCLHPGMNYIFTKIFFFYLYKIYPGDNLFSDLEFDPWDSKQDCYSWVKTAREKGTLASSALVPSKY